MATPKTQIPIAFGTMTFGREGEEQSRVFKHEDCQKILDVFKSHGHIELDTARAYGAGTSEEYLRDMGVEKQGFKIATKVFPNARFTAVKGWKVYTHEGKGSSNGVHVALEDSLRALGTQKVDLYYLHAPDREVPFAQTLEAINEEYKAGHFERFGISNYKAEEVNEIVEICQKNGWVKPSVYQGLYNAIVRSAEPELIPTLKKHGISYYTYNPLGGGFFTGNVQKDKEVEAGSRFDGNKWQGQMYQKRYFKDSYWAALEQLKPVAAKHNLSLGEIALRWLQHHSQLSRDKGDHIIIGASSLNHIETNLKDFEKGPLDEEVVKAVDTAWEYVKAESPPYHF